MFSGPGVATVSGVTGAVVDQALRDGPVVVGLQVHDDGPQGGPARILTLSAGIRDIDLMIGQQDQSLVVRVRRSGSTAAGRPAIVVDDVLDGASHAIEVRLTSTTAEVAVDGMARGRVEGIGADSGWDPDHRLLLGNEHGGSRSWRGRLATATLTTPTGRLDLVEASVVPDHLWILPDRWTGETPWSAPFNPTASQLVQAIVFTAVGALAIAAFRDRPWWVVWGSCASFSLLLLAAKFLAAGRHPSLADLVVEVSAAGIGVAVGRRWQRRALLVR